MYLHNQHLVCSRHKHPVNCGGGHDKVLPEKDETATTLGQEKTVCVSGSSHQSLFINGDLNIFYPRNHCFTFHF